MRRLIAGSMIVTGLLLATAAPSGGAPGSTDRDAARELARARQATAKYHDVARAEADGYVSTVECASSPAGAMGVHYVNVDLIDGVLDVERPEVLLYVPKRDRLKLVGVEYMTVDADQDPATAGDRPALFGRAFDGPMAGHGPGQPVHYDLHAWIWQANPTGIFEQWNPKLRCPGT